MELEYECRECRRRKKDCDCDCCVEEKLFRAAPRVETRCAIRTSERAAQARPRLLKEDDDDKEKCKRNLRVWQYTCELHLEKRIAYWVEKCKGAGIAREQCPRRHIDKIDVGGVA